MTATPREFATLMAQTCIPQTRPGALLFFVSVEPGTYFETRDGADMMIRLSVRVFPEAVYLVFVRLKDAGYNGEPVTGLVVVDDGRDHMWEFYCTLEINQVQAIPMTVAEQCTELGQAVCTSLNRLGSSVEAIEQRLCVMGHSPDLAGLSRYIASVFGLYDVDIEFVTHRGVSTPVISGNRPDSPVHLMFMDSFSPLRGSSCKSQPYNLSAALHSFLLRGLVAA